MPPIRTLALLAAAVAVLFSLPAGVGAIGISPARIDLNFEPGMNATYSFFVRTEGSISDIKIVSKKSDKCGFTDYIEPSVSEIDLPPGEIFDFYVNVELPEDAFFEPGLHECGVVAEEVAPEGGGGIAAYSAAQTSIWIWVPYPEKYVMTNLNAPNVNISEPVDFALSATSRGTENVTASGLIKVTDPEGRNVATLTTGDVFLASMEKKTMTARWETTGMPAGTYSASSTVEYGADEPSLSSTEFKIGDMLIKIANITADDEIYPGDIAKMSVVLDSYWNSPIEDVYVTLEVYDNGIQKSSSRSETFDMGAWETRTVPIYWDTEGTEAGAYEGRMTVHYSGRTTVQSFPVEIKSGQDLLLLVLIALVVAAVTAVLIYILRRKKKGR